MSEPKGQEMSEEAQIRMLVRILEEERRSAKNAHAHLSDGSDVDLPEIDFRTILAELTALKAAVRADASAARDIRDRFSTAIEVLEKELAGAREREDRLAADWEARASIAARRAALDLIEIADRLEPAIERARNITKSRWGWLPWRRPDDAIGALVKGLELTWRRLDRQLEEQGVRRLPTVGEHFDPSTMKAVEHVERDDVAEGVVVQEVGAGYVYEEGRGRQGDSVKVVRVAQVVVNREPDTMGC